MAMSPSHFIFVRKRHCNVRMDSVSRARMQTLPPELLEDIFAEPCLTLTDFSNLCITCKTFEEVLQCNWLWRMKFQQRWPVLYTELEERKLLMKSDTEPFWRLVCSQRMLVKKMIGKQLDEMGADTRKQLIKYHKVLGESEYYGFYDKLPRNMDTKVAYAMVVDELKHILSGTHEWENLTQKYYADKALWCLHHQRLCPELESFMAVHEDERDIEVGATLIAQWFQPRTVFSVKDIKQHFDSLANQTKEVLKTLNPQHPVLSRTHLFNPQEVTGSLWDTTLCSQIIQAIEILVKPLFNQDLEEYYAVSNSFINLVLETKRGIPITLCLVVMCVARRLGLVLQPVNFPHHFVLRWTQYPLKRGIDNFSFVDVYGGTYDMTFGDLHETFSRINGPVREEHCAPCSHMEVLRRMMKNLLNLGKNEQSDTGLDLMRRTVDLASFIMPNNVDVSMLKMQIALHLKLNVLAAMDQLQEVAMRPHPQHDLILELQERGRELLHTMQQSTIRSHGEVKEKRRSKYPKVRLAVGMVMKHRRYNYLCVIRGWDSKCEFSDHWIRQMGVDELPRGRHQPFYNVFVMDGSDRYAAEENLEFTTDAQPIDHVEVGRFFERFTGEHYVPCQGLRTEYPDDLAVTRRRVTRFFARHRERSSTA